MRGSAAFLVGLAVAICSAEGYSIERPKPEAKTWTGTTEIPAENSSNGNSRVMKTEVKRSIPNGELEPLTGNLRTELPSKDVSIQLERVSKVFLLMKLKILIDHVLDENNRKLRQFGYPGQENLEKNTVEWLTKVKRIIESEINNLVLLIADGQYVVSRNFGPSLSSESTGKRNRQRSGHATSALGLSQPLFRYPHPFTVGTSINHVTDNLKNAIELMLSSDLQNFLQGLIPFLNE